MYTICAVRYTRMVWTFISYDYNYGNMQQENYYERCHGTVEFVSLYAIAVVL